MKVLVTNPAHLLTIALCTMVCIAYYVPNILFQRYFIIPSWSDILLLNGYSLLLSTPVMPFVYGATKISFSVPLISLFALSNFIWQIFFISTFYKKDWKGFFVSLSLTNLISWGVMAFVNYRLYKLLVQWIYYLFK